MKKIQRNWYKFNTLAMVWWTDELFTKQNQHAYIDLTNYELGIRRLCEHLGVVYFPASLIPRDQDFREEVFSAGLKCNYVKELVEMYTRFRDEYSTRPSIARNWLINLIARLDDLQASIVVSPRIALGVMEAEAGQHKNAAAVFQRFAELQPADPRAWAGLGGARFYLCDYQGALRAYNQCKEMILRTGHSEHIAHLADIAHNTAQVLLTLGQTEQAWQALEYLSPAGVQAEAYGAALRGRIRLQQRYPSQAVGYLEAALAIFDNRCHQTPPASLMLDLVDCYRLLHRHTDEEKIMQRSIAMFKDDPEMFRSSAGQSLYDFNVESTIQFLRKAIRLAPESVIYQAELASILYYIGNMEASRRTAKACLELEENVQTSRDNYYLGLAYYILGKREVADNKLEKARRMDSIIAGWPIYEKLLNGCVNMPFQKKSHHAISCWNNFGNSLKKLLRQ